MSSWHRRFQRCLSPLWKRTQHFISRLTKKTPLSSGVFFYFANFYAALEAFLAAKAFIVSMM